MKENIIINETNNLEESKINNFSERNRLILKEKELTNLEKQIEIRKKDLEERITFLNNKEIKLLQQEEDNTGVEEEKTKYGEVLEDVLLENVNEITNKRPNKIIENVVSFLIAFIRGGITYEITKKWRIIHG